MSTYLIDTNVLIHAHRMYYPFDVVPGFWNKMVELSHSGTIKSIDKVKNEICDPTNTDTLGRWCLNSVSDSFFDESSHCIGCYSEIALWAVEHDQYTSQAVADFLQTEVADPWLVAYAMKNACTIVTHEVSQPLGRKKIKIPDTCNNFGVKWINPIEMFRELRASF